VSWKLLFWQPLRANKVLPAKCPLLLFRSGVRIIVYPNGALGPTHQPRGSVTDPHNHLSAHVLVMGIDEELLDVRQGIGLCPNL